MKRTTKVQAMPPLHIHLDYSDSQIPPSEDYLLISKVAAGFG